MSEILDGTTTEQQVRNWLGKNNSIGADIFIKKYLVHGESFEEWLNRVSGGNPEVRRLIYEKKFLFGGRVLANRGIATSGSLSNCYSHGFIKDDYSDILDAVKNLGMTYKAQGGQGVSLSKLRPKGAPIGKYYTSDGIVPFMKLYNQVTDSTSQGGCLDENSLVLTNRGLVKIKDIKIGDKAWTKKGFIDINFVYDKGIQATYKITTKKGLSISATADHKFATSVDGESKMSDLKIGDKVLLLNGEYPTDGKENLVAYFLGAFMGDGYIPPKADGIVFKGDKTKLPVADKLITSLHSIGKTAHYQTSIDENNPYFVLRFDSDTAKWMVANGWDKDGAGRIFIPDFVINGDYNTRLSYICGAFDTDGSNSTQSNTVKYSTICEEYANQLVCLIRSVGLNASFTVEEREPPKQNLYVINASTMFGLGVLPYGVRVGVNLDNNASSTMKTPYTMAELGWKANKNNHLGKISYASEIGFYTLVMNFDINHDPVPMVYDEIVSINKNDTHSHVYDISLESEHFFWCNGFYVSNSRKGALMISLDARHKEAMDFITIKSESGIIEKANISLEVDDIFMEAVEKFYQTGEVIVLHEKREYSGHIVEYDVVPINVFEALVNNSWDWGDPACLFMDEFRTYNMMEFVDEYKIENCNP